MADFQSLRCQGRFTYYLIQPFVFSWSILTFASTTASIEASLSPLQIQLGRLSLPSESSLHTLLAQSFSKLTEIFNIHDPSSLLTSQSTFQHIMDSILDTTSRPFVNPNSEPILAGLDDHDKAVLYLQAVAGMVLVFERLKSCDSELSAGVLARKLRLFSESKERQSVLDAIAGSHCFSESYTRSDVVAFLVNAIEARKADEYPPVGDKEQELLGLGKDSSWESERPCKNMGLPWGFTIMALN